MSLALPKNPKTRSLTLGLLLMALGATAAAPPVAVWAQAQAEQSAAREQARAHARALSQAFRDAAQMSTPSVVKIESRTKAKRVSRSQSPTENPFKGTPFEDFFNDRNGGFNTPPQQGVGSGVVIDAAGVILTNNHVVENADEVVVVMQDGTEYKATDVRTDPRTDLAVVRVKPEGSLPAAKLGDSDQMFTGDWVIAVGNPFELDQTVSAGIISGQGRELGTIERTRFLQTDAAINPGNSGGPLVNLDGEVVGINTAIASNSGGYQGIGFAIPINLAKRVAQQLIDKGTVDRAYLGIGIGELTQALADQFGVKRGQGVVVAQVYPNTPAAEAGLQEGDVITTFAGKPVRRPAELQEIVELCPVDSKQVASVVRGGKAMEVTLTMKALPNEFGNAGGHAQPTPEKQEEGTNFSEELGIGVSNLTSDVAKQLNLPDDKGVLITQVDETSMAYEKGLREGMVVLKVGQTEVKNVTEYQEAIGKLSLDQGILLLVRTEKGNQFVVLKK